jgi:glycosyltransferase involved in cell wall biosynthesis
VVEVIVAENGGAHGAADVVELLAPRFGRVELRHLLLEDGNKCRALNAALAATRADLICFFDDDVLIAEEAIEAYVDAATRYGPGHQFSGPLVPDWEREPPEWLMRYLPPSAKGWYHGNEERYFDEPYFIGSNWAAFGADILRVGGYDERIGPGSRSGAIGDEMELQQRLLDAGSRGVYLPRASIRHHVPADRCDFRWAVGRQRVEGRTYAILGWPPHGGPIDTGVRGRLALASLDLKVLVARGLGWPDERRAWLETRRAKLRGYLEGTRFRRHLT